jgi:hypothetical protein
MAVTRIKNNQITDSTITYQKIAPGTLVGSVFNANLTLNSNVTIAGNLTVSGNTTTVDSIDTLVSDNLITLNNGYVGVPAYDVGILFNRALGTLENYGGVNAALVWSESDGAFIAVLTTETGTTAGTINRTFQANMIVGNLTVSNTATIQTATITNLNVTNQNVAGLTSTGNIVAASGTVATNYTTGAIVVPDGGGVGITGDLWVQGPSTFAGNIVAGNILLSGNINVPVGGTFSNLGVFFGNAGGIGALYAGTSTYTALPTTVLQMSGNVDTYAQVNFQNINSGTKASTDFVLTADNGDDTDGFIDLGINSSTFNDANYPGSYPNDGYLIHHSGLSTGNLVIFSHTEGSAIKLHVGDYGDANTKATVTSTGFRVNTSTASTSTTSGALTVDGGVGVAGNIHAAAINNTPIGNTTPGTGRFTYLTVDTGFSTANAIIDGGNINLGNNYVQAAYINSFYSNSFNILAANLTVGNVEIFNGNVSANLSSTNAVITGGYIDETPIGANIAATGNFTTANATSFFGDDATVAVINSTDGNVTTLVATNFSTANADITGGLISNTDAQINNFSSGNVLVTGGLISNTDAQINNFSSGNVLVTGGLISNTDAQINNFSSGNVLVTGGYIDETPIGPNIASTGNFTTANATSFTGYDATVAVINSTTGNITTLVADNFSSGNVLVTGGYIDETPIGPNLASTGNFTTANATSFTGYDATVAVINSTTGNITTSNSTTVNAETTTTTNLNSTNGNITTVNAETTTTTNLNSTNGNITTSNSSTVNAETTTTVDLNVTNGNVTTLVANNFSTANAVVTGGYADNFPIGANTASTGAFTSLTSNGLTTFTDSTESDNSASGAVVVTGGVGIGGNLNVSGNIVVTGNLTVQGNTTVLNTETLNVEDLNITVAANATTGSEADGAGLTVAGANATLTYVNATDSWEVNKPFAGFGITMFQGNFTSANITTLSTSDVNVAVATIATLNSTLANITTGNIDTINSSNGNITTLVAGNFSTANAVITGGSLNSTPIGANTASTGNFTNANAASYTGYEATITTVNATTGNITTSNSTTVNADTTITVNLNSTNGNITTMVATNLSTANAVINGGSISGTNAQINNFSSGNVLVTGGLVSNTDAQINNFSSGNVLVTGGVLSNIDLQANNFSTGNAVITGGYINSLANLTVTEAEITNFSTANALVTGGLISNTDAQINNFSSGNVLVTGGYIDETPIGPNIASTGNFTTANANTVTAYSITGTDLNATNGNATTLVANNFSTANAVITGGFADNFSIGANIAATGNFTSIDSTSLDSTSVKTGTLDVTANVYLSPQSAPATVTINPLNGGAMDGITIGATNAANVYATNFRTSTSLWAAPTGTVWIQGGTGTNGINNIPIGAVTPSSGVFTTVNGQTITGTTVNGTNGNITTLGATNFSSGNVVVSGGYISALTNAYVTTGLITNFSTANARITGGFADHFPVGANTRASGAFTTLTAHSLNATVIGNVTPAAATFTTINGTSGTFTGEISATGITTSGTVPSSLQGNVTFSNGTFVVNNSNDDWEIVVRGVNENSLLKVAADTVYDQVSIGGNITAANITQGAKLVINSTDAVVLPVGTSAQRPGAVGFADVDGMLRYNSTINSLEFYGDGEWNSTASTFTTILSRTFADVSGNPNGNVDGVNTQFTLAASSTTAGTLVSISGVLQIPVTAYTVSGNVVTFTEAPAIDDVIDTRIITTTTTLDTLAAPAGYNQYFVDDTALRFYTGNLSLGSVENWRMDTHGDFYPVTTANIGYPNNRVDYFYVGNINVSGTISGASLSSGNLDDTVIGANIARLGSFTTLFADSTFTTNAEHVTDDVRGKFVAPGATDAVYGFATATYRSGKFFVQLSDENAGEYQAAEIVAVHNGTTCSIEVYGVTFTGVANLATFSTNVSAGTAYLNASSAGANLAIKVTPTLMKL